jgi:hypothetical protein
MERSDGQSAIAEVGAGDAVHLAPAPVADVPVAAGDRPAHRGTPVLALLLGAGLAAAALPLLPTQVPRDDLAPLLLGMAAIKGLLVLLGAAALAWRFGFPIARALARRYLLAVALGAGAAVLIAGHVVTLSAAALFHAGELLFLFTAWQDGRPAR